VSVSLDCENWIKVTDELDVPFTGVVMQVVLLPKIVIGKYVKLDLIGKCTPQPGDEAFYIVMEHVEAIGCCFSSLKENSYTM